MKYLFLVFGFIGALNAQDRIFNYTYQSSVLSPGDREIEPWMTYRYGRVGFFKRLDSRLEFEFGVAPRLQTSFYINSTTQARHLDSTLHTDSEISFSNEWKYKLTDPVADAFGSALYGEVTLGRAETEIEAKLILDKRIGKNTIAFNLVGELEFENEAEKREVETERETKIELNFGLAHSFSNHWNLGMEARNLNVMAKGRWEYSAIFAGPTISYFAETFWINGTFMPQWKALKGSTHNGLVLSNLEKFQTRLIFSFVL